MKIPTGWQRRLFRLPIYLYRWYLGWLMPKRFLCLTHIGRKSNQPRYAVVEVADYDQAADTYYIVSGYGVKANWYQNLLHTPQATIQVRHRQYAVLAQPLSPTESGQKMVEYAQTYPKTAQQLMTFLGYKTDGSAERYRQIGEENVRFVALQKMMG